MAKQTDIKSLSIFGGENPGLQKMREEALKKYSEKTTLIEDINITQSNDKTVVKNEFNESSEQKIIANNKQNRKNKNPKGAGAPIRQFDRVYSAKSPLKLSALLNSTSRNLVEKYETQLSRDELLRKALDEYVRQHLSLEDKQELFHAVLKDLEIFREKFPTIPERDQHKEIIREASEIEEETERELKKRWGIK